MEIFFVYKKKNFKVLFSKDVFNWSKAIVKTYIVRKYLSFE